jgi:hypothetical protein
MDLLALAKRFPGTATTRTSPPTRESMTTEGGFLEAWAQGYNVGSLIILILIVFCNYRSGIWLHKLILLEVSLDDCSFLQMLCSCRMTILSRILSYELLHGKYNTDQLSLFLPSGTAHLSLSKTPTMAGSSARLRVYFSYHTFFTTSSRGSRSDPSCRSGVPVSSSYLYFAFSHSG